MSWKANDGVHSALLAQRFSSSGTAVGDNFEVAPYALGPLYGAPSVAVGDDGTLLIVWHEEMVGPTPIPTSIDIFGRLGGTPTLPSLGILGLLGLAAIKLVAGALSLHTQRRAGRKS